MSGADDTIRVLHVDDDGDFLDVAATFLEREDERIDVRTATGPEDGLDALAEHEVDCVVSDYEMPGRNGIEFLEAVRERYRALPFILYTGKGSEEIASEAISVGVTDYLQKGHGTDQYTILANRITNAVLHTRAERAVTSTRKYFGTILEQASDFVMVVDEDGEIDYVSPAVERVMGYVPAGLEGDDAFERIHPDDLSIAAEAFAAVLDRPDEEHSIEYRARHADGSWRWLAVRGRNRLDDPVIEGVVVSARDITARKERERELRRKERRYQAVFNDPNILVGLIDTDGTVLDVNRTALDYVDATVDQIAGEPLWETPWFDHSAAVQRDVRAWIDQASDGEYVEFEVDLRTPDGEPYTVDGVFRPVTDDDGDVVSLLISDRDVSERKHRERAIERLHETAQELLRADTREGIADVAVDAAEDVLDLPLCSVHLAEGGDGRLTPVAYTESLTEIVGDPPPAMEPGDGLAWAVYEAGEPRWYDDVSVVPGRLNDEPAVRSEIIVPLGDHGVFVASSPEVGAFDEVLVSLAKILAAHAETALGRVERERDLQRQNERLDEFAGTVSHDLRNPLRVAEGRLDLAREECASEHLDALEDALGRIDRLIEDVLTFAREGGDVDDAGPVDLGGAAEAAWAIAADDHDGVALTVREPVRREGARIEADDDRLRQLLENLFRNATEHGGERVAVAVGLLEDGFYVEDDGPGIPPDEREQAFEAGYSTATEGTGFGLSIVAQIVDAHGWEIRIEDGADGGARFEITGVRVVDD